MEISSLLSNFSVFDTEGVSAASSVSSNASSKDAQSSSRTTSGDTVSISDKARELLAQIQEPIVGAWRDTANYFRCSFALDEPNPHAEGP